MERKKMRIQKDSCTAKTQVQYNTYTYAHSNERQRKMSDEGGAERPETKGNELEENVRKVKSMKDHKNKTTQRAAHEERNKNERKDRKSEGREEE